VRTGLAGTFWLLVALSGIVAATGCQPADSHPAKTFLEQVYGKYRDGESGPDTLNKDAPQLFAPELLALVREDQQRAGGEAGVLDHDPVCACQDFGALKVTRINVVPGDAGRARADVDFKNAGKSVRVSFSLREDAGQWRIEDIEEPMIPSLRKFLADGLAKPASTTP
jgi:hypothetical protein